MTTAIASGHSDTSRKQIIDQPKDGPGESQLGQVIAEVVATKDGESQHGEVIAEVAATKDGESQHGQVIAEVAATKDGESQHGEVIAEVAATKDGESQLGQVIAEVAATKTIDTDCREEGQETAVNRIFSKVKGVFRSQESVRKILKSGRSISSAELSEDDVIIALMGPTGAGKSSFIKMATGFDSRIGHELQSCTTQIEIIRVQFVEKSHFDVVFVDTPGFDDTNKSDGEILEMIAHWLKTTYERHITLSGILYLHRISDNRMAGTPLKNLRIFKKLCGKNALHNIILTTTMWDEVKDNEGSQREKELKEKYWKIMLNQGSAVARYGNTPESAWEIVGPLLRESNKRSAVRLQQEMVGLKKQLPDTKAGAELYTRLEVVFRKQQDTLQRIRVETERAENEGVLDDLRAEYDELRKKVEVIVADMQALKVPLRRRLFRVLMSPLELIRV